MVVIKIMIVMMVILMILMTKNITILLFLSKSVKNFRVFYLVKKGPKKSGKGNPPPFGAMPERKCAFSYDVFPYPIQTFFCRNHYSIMNMA